MSPKTLIDFDLDRYLRASKRLDLSELPWEDVPNHPLTDGDVMCLHYMMDIETHTVIYLRDLLATRAANDPHGVPLVLGLRGAARRGLLGVPGFLRPRGSRRTQAARRLDPDADACAPRPSPARAVRRRPPAAPPPHNDRLDGHASLHRYPHDLGCDQRADHPPELPRVDPPRARPGAPPAAAAGHPGRAPPLRLLPRPGPARLEVAPPRARKLVRWAFKNFWTPVGAGVKSQEEVDALGLYLFSDDEGREQVRDIDRRVSELPGLEGLTLVEDGLDAAIERARRRPGYAGRVAPPGAATAERVGAAVA